MGNNHKSDADNRYRNLWKLGTILSFLLYYSGCVWIYKYFRKKIFCKNITIVLTYHKICDDNKYPDISVSIRNFRRQLTYLINNYNFIPLDSCFAVSSKSIGGARDNIAITFDDGYKDNFLNAYPILKQFNMPATIFLVSQFINKKEEFLNSAQIMEMRQWNISYGSHTAAHQILSEIKPDIAKQEIINSKSELESLLNEKIEFFAYPKGKSRHLNDFIKGQIKTAGYKAAFITENGRIDKDGDLFALKRIGIRNCPMFVFKARVSGIFESNFFYLIRSLFKMT